MAVPPISSHVCDEKLLSVDDIADMLAKSPESIRRLCRNGRLSSYNFGGKYVITGRQLQKFLDAHRQSTKSKDL